MTTKNYSDFHYIIYLHIGAKQRTAINDIIFRVYVSYSCTEKKTLVTLIKI